VSTETVDQQSAPSVHRARHFRMKDGRQLSRPLKRIETKQHNKRANPTINEHTRASQTFPTISSLGRLMGRTLRLMVVFVALLALATVLMWVRRHVECKPLMIGGVVHLGGC
jgi:hypothetical protein